MAIPLEVRTAWSPDWRSRQFVNAVDRDLGEAVHGEIKRLADQRAECALRPAPGVATVPDHLLKARSAVGHATMVLLAIEVQSLDGEVTVKTLRTILRRQRPTLPR